MSLQLALLFRGWLHKIPLSSCHPCNHASYVLFSSRLNHEDFNKDLEILVRNKCKPQDPKAELLPIWLLAADPDAEAVFRKDAPGRRSDLGQWIPQKWILQAAPRHGRWEDGSCCTSPPNLSLGSCRCGHLPPGELHHLRWGSAPSGSPQRCLQRRPMT